MCAAKRTVYRFWKLETYVLENHSFPEKILSTTLVKNQDRGGGGGEDGWGGEGRELWYLPKIRLAVMCPPNRPGTRFKSLQGMSALKKSVKTRK